MTTSDVQPAGQQPGTPGNEWATPPVQPEKKSGAKKWAGIAGTVAVVGVGAAYSLTGGFGIGAPAVGDCVQELADAEIAVVDCGSSDADYTIVGIMGEKQTEEEFMADPASCAEFSGVEAAFWESNGFVYNTGTVYCAGPV